MDENESMFPDETGFENCDSCGLETDAAFMQFFCHEDGFLFLLCAECADKLWWQRDSNAQHSLSAHLAVGALPEWYERFTSRARPQTETPAPVVTRSRKRVGERLREVIRVLTDQT